MLKEMKETIQKLEEIKTSTHAVAELLKSGVFNTEDVIKVLNRISESI